MFNTLYGTLIESPPRSRSILQAGKTAGRVGGATPPELRVERGKIPKKKRICTRIHLSPSLLRRKGEQQPRMEPNRAKPSQVSGRPACDSAAVPLADTGKPTDNKTGIELVSRVVRAPNGERRQMGRDFDGGVAPASYGPCGRPAGLAATLHVDSPRTGWPRVVFHP
ncbi:hypothetical protein SKAU_G00339950 [Synaphobranchus kaupii]|uniref:Uncharacterized protein n=1 Tax=Synaphobranchus kaupii TaxID=118154 RepID=A0A9Q1EMS5_SYNKA|nr:hypothetical protein SKAU_G00339950 [Synaphobranchus kaupii]